MRSHPVHTFPTVAVNTFWCLLIAVLLLAFPVIARQARLHSSVQRTQTPAPASLGKPSTHVSASVKLADASEPVPPHR